MAEPVRTEDVFGIRVEPVLSYVERPNVDGAFEQALKTDNHIVIYGSSKQGKTALRQKHLDDQRDCVIVRPSPRSKIEGLYLPILRGANIRIETVESSETEGSSTGRLRTGFKAFIPWLGGTELGMEGELKTAKKATMETEFIGYDLGEAQSVGELLAKVKHKRFVVVENFHYLVQDVQQQLAFDLKTFHELKLRFIVLGIWRGSNRLPQFNNDLQGRIVEVPVEPWLEDDLRTVAKKGAETLNVEFDPDILTAFVENSYGNVGLFQEFLKTFCLECQVKGPEPHKRRLTDQKALEITFEKNLRDQTIHLLQSLQSIAAQSRTRAEEDPLLLPYYLTKVILRAEVKRLQEGIDKKLLLQLLRDVHHRPDKSTVRIGDVTNLINHLPALQEKMQPPLLYFDASSRRLKIVDTSKFFVLAKCDRKDLEEEIPSPLEDTGS